MSMSIIAPSQAAALLSCTAAYVGAELNQTHTARSMRRAYMDAGNGKNPLESREAFMNLVVAARTWCLTLRGGNLERDYLLEDTSFGGFLKDVWFSGTRIPIHWKGITTKSEEGKIDVP